MRVYIVRVAGIDYKVKAYSARGAIQAVLKSLIGTRTAEKILKTNRILFIEVRRQVLHDDN